MGPAGPAALNAANETAVAAFLDHRIGFLDIARACEETLQAMDRSGELAVGAGDPIQSALSIDRRARAVADAAVGAMKAPLEART